MENTEFLEDDNQFKEKFCQLSEPNQKYIIGVTQALIFSQNQDENNSEAIHIKQ